MAWHKYARELAGIDTLAMCDFTYESLFLCQVSVNPKLPPLKISRAQAQTFSEFRHEFWSVNNGEKMEGMKLRQN